MIIPIIVFSVIIIAGITLLVCHLTQKKYDKFILQNSVCLEQLKEINSRYNFYPAKNFNQAHTYDNEKFYGNISCKDYLIYQLQYIGKDISTQINKMNINKLQYINYLDEIKTNNQFGQFRSSIGKLKLAKLVKKRNLR